MATASGTGPGPAPAEPRESGIDWGLILRRFGTLIGFVLIVLYFWARRPDTFMQLGNWLNITQQVSILAVIAFTSTVVMVVGDFDLSVGSMVSLSGIVAAVLITNGQSLAVAVMAAILVGAIGGVLNGLLVAYLGISAFIATLGTLTVFAGTALVVSDGTTIFGRELADSIATFARGGIPLGTTAEGRAIRLPNLTLVAVAVLGIMWIILEQTVFGRRLYAIGGNYEAARLSGVRVRPLRLLAFVFSGVGASIGGLMLVSRLATANPTQGEGYMLQAIASVFLGMTLSEEGEPHVLGTLLGVLILGVLANGLTQLNVDTYIQQILTGAIIVLAVTLSSLSRSRRG